MLCTRIATGQTCSLLCSGSGPVRGRTTGVSRGAPMRGRQCPIFGLQDGGFSRILPYLGSLIVVRVFRHRRQLMVPGQRANEKGGQDNRAPSQKKSQSELPIRFASFTFTSFFSRGAPTTWVAIREYGISCLNPHLWKSPNGTPTCGI